MPEQNYPIPESPVYDPIIRALQDSDPGRATTIFNPLFERLIENTHALKLLLNVLQQNSATLESPAFTGAPTAPTADDKSNDTQIANTEFVCSAITNTLQAAGSSSLGSAFLGSIFLGV